MKQTRSAAMVGFIVGVLVGLGAALAVAVFVTKVPVPFTNKAQGRNPTQEAVEAQRNKDWDPNAALQGKNQSRPAATPAATASAPVVPATAGRTDTKPGASTDPLGDLARLRASATPPVVAPTGVTTAPALAKPPAAGVDPFSYFVQAGAFRTAEDAEAQRAKLSLLGMESRVTEREQSGRTVFRVRVGPFDRKEDADRSKERLDGNGFETALVRVQR